MVVFFYIGKCGGLCLLIVNVLVESMCVPFLHVVLRALSFLKMPLCAVVLILQPLFYSLLNLVSLSLATTRVSVWGVV